MNEIYEYTADGETVKNWSTLVTLMFTKNQKQIATDWIDRNKRALDSQNPKPHYSLYILGNNAYSIEIYEPIPSDMSYEATVKKVFFIDACSSPIHFAFAKRYPSIQDVSDEVKREKLVGIAQEAKKRIKELETATWKPRCVGSAQ